MNKIFDSLNNKDFCIKNKIKNIKNFHIPKKGSIIINISDNFFTKYTIKIIGMNISGNGKFRVLNDKGKILSENILSSRSDSEVSFDIEDQSLSESKHIKISLSSIRSKIIFKRITIFSHNFLSYKKAPYVEDQEYERKIGFIVPYSIYGGAEVYLKNMILSEFYKNYKIILMQDNKISNYFNDKNIIKTDIKNLDKVFKEELFDTICFYNSQKIYHKITSLRSIFKFKIVEIYHSDFKWSDSMSNLEHHDVDWIIRTGSEVGNQILEIKSFSTIIPPSIDLRKFTPRKKSSNLIGTVARLSDEKNLKYLVKLKKYMPNKKFVVYGEGSRSIKLFLNKNGIETPGFCENIFDKYNFESFILPSKKEGLPFTLIEALASNIPSFSFSSGAIPSVMSNFKYNWKLTGDPKKDSLNILKCSKERILFSKKYINRYCLKENSRIFFETINKKSKNVSSMYRGKINPNEYFDSIYCINLDSRRDKWEKVRSRFKKYGLSVDRYSAKDFLDPEVQYYFKKLFYIEPDKKVRDRNKFARKPEEIGCLLSHLDIIITAKKKGFKKILILEDDVVFHKNFINEFSFIKLLKEDWAMIYLGASQYSWRGVSPHSSKFYYAKDSDGTFAYAINLKYFDTIISELRKIKSPIDWHYRVGVQNVLKKKCFVFFPNLVIADTTDSDIRGPIPMNSRSKTMKWDLSKYDL